MAKAYSIHLNQASVGNPRQSRVGDFQSRTAWVLVEKHIDAVVFISSHVDTPHVCFSLSVMAEPTQSYYCKQCLVGLSRKIWSPENFGPRTILSEKIGLGGPIFFKILVCPVV